MPVINGVGQSINTRIKLGQLPRIFEAHISITNAVIKKNLFFQREYLYIDATAGPGRYIGISEMGSPLCFAKIVTEKNIPHKAKLIDKQKENLLSLIDKLPQGFNYDVLQGNYEEIIPKIIRNTDDTQLGLLYIDPNNEPDLKTVEYISTHRPRMEILLYISATNMKRIGKSITEYFNAQKQNWLIRRPQDAHQWVFMLGTNTKNLDKFRSIDMFPINEPRGQAFLQKVAFTEKERQLKCQLSFIEPMQNTFIIQNSSLSVVKLLTAPKELASDVAKNQ